MMTMLDSRPLVDLAGVEPADLITTVWGRSAPAIVLVLLIKNTEQVSRELHSSRHSLSTLLTLPQYVFDHIPSPGIKFVNRLHS